MTPPNESNLTSIPPLIEAISMAAEWQPTEGQEPTIVFVLAGNTTQTI